MLKNPVVSVPIVGVTKSHHLSDAAAALDIELTDAENRAPSGSPGGSYDAELSY
jgi:1-deoxyxylulose-5-phosphate synthase